MIFVTVGTQLPFDRMIHTIDLWAKKNKPFEAFAQIGPSKYKPTYIKWADFISPDEYKSNLEKAKVLVAHAGMGSILSALEAGKPIIILPRQTKYNEHRNDHQMATAKHFEKIDNVYVAFNEKRLIDLLENLDYLHSSRPISSHASNELIDSIKNFIQS